MRRLLRVELRRLRWRRAVMVLLAAAVILPAVVFTVSAWETRPLGADDITRAEELAAQEAAQPWVAEELGRCEERPEDYGGPGTTTEQCVEMVMPKAENYLYRPELVVSEVRENQGAAMVVLLAAIFFVISTTLVGHDWNTGSMSNQLLFESRRLRVWWAKALAVVLAAVVASVVVLALFWAAVAGLAAARDVTTSGETWRGVATMSGRGVVVVALAGLLGHASTMLFRSTVATLAIGFAAATGSSVLILSVLGDAGNRWLPSTNGLAFLLNGTTYYDWGPQCEQMYTGTGGGEMIDPCLKTVTLAQGSTYWLLIIVVLVAVSLWSFRRRDLP